MTSRTDQLAVALPDGLIIDRLPVGRANGHWHLSFVCSGVDFNQGHPPRAMQFHEEFRSRVSVAALAGDLVSLGGGGRGDEDEQDMHMRFADNGVTALEIIYTYEGALVASEVIDLS